jgi:hypothetical protein
MSKNQKHILQKQIIDIQTSSINIQEPLTEKLRSLYYERLLPEMQDVFSSIVDENTWIRLDRLELELGVLPEENLSDTLTSKLREVLYNKLKDIVEEGSQKQASNSSLNVVNRTQETFFFFLDNGYLPWWYSSEDLFELEENVLSQINSHPDFKEKLLEKISTDSICLSRLQKQFSNNLILRILDNRD